MKIKSHQVSFVPGSNLQLLVEISRENRRILRLDLALVLALLVGGGIGAVIVAGLLDPANCLPWSPLNRWGHWIGIC